MKVLELDVDDPRLIAFLERTKHLIFHTPVFGRFIAESFGCEYRFVAAFEGEDVVTLLPVVEVKSRFFGNRVISSAYLEYGGFCGALDGVEMILSYLVQKYGQNFDYLEIRGGLEEFDLVLSGTLERRSLYKRFVLRLGAVDTVWKGIQHSKRKAINKAIEHLQVRELLISDIDDFYRLYLANMRTFGSPPYNRAYFERFFEYFVSHGQGKIYGTFYNGILISALVGFCYQDRIHILIAVSDPKHQEFRPNDAMHWEFIKWGCEHNYTFFDFGRVREESGQFEYKQKWGPELLELPSYFLFWQACDYKLIDPKRSRYVLISKFWKLVPLKVTEKMGMRLRKELGI